MMSALLLRAACVLLSLGLVFTVACGGGGDEDRLSEEEYFERVEESVNGTEAEIREAHQDSEGPGISEDELRDRIVANDRLRVSGYRQLADDLERLKPPEVRITLHDDLVASVRNYADKLALFIDLYESTELDEDADANDPALAAFADAFQASDVAGKHFGAMCAAVADSADRAGHTIHLDCAEFGGDNQDGGQTIDIAPGIRGRLAEMPPLPEGLAAASHYIEFEVGGENLASVIGMPLDDPAADAEALAFYSYEDGEWKRLEVALSLEDEGRVASGAFESVPPSLTVLREE